MKINNYLEAENYLNNVPRFTSKNPMEDTKRFYAFLIEEGFNQTDLGSIVHVAGTNGKGSVCAFVESVCRQGSYKTAMFTSPHLITTRERFSIDGESVSEEDFLEGYNWLETKMEKYREINPKYMPTYFERLFFMGIYIFSKAKPDITILETGLGGRLDTTNIIERPAVTVITEIGFDHMAYLGDTLQAIAGEKAGIIKQGAPLIYSDRKKEVSDILEQKSAERGIKTYPVSKKDYKIIEIKKKYIDFSFINRYDSYVSLKINTSALYQIENAGIAYRTCEILRDECGFDLLFDDIISDGIEKMHWMGRMDEIRHNIYIDGAHNEDGIEAFAESVEYSALGVNDPNYIIVFSAVRDKQYDRMIRRLCRLDCVRSFIVTHIPGDRGTNLEELKDIFNKYLSPGKSVYAYDDIEKAIEQSILLMGDKGRIYIVGSLYLAGIVEDIFTERKKDK